MGIQSAIAPARMPPYRITRNGSPDLSWTALISMCRCRASITTSSQMIRGASFQRASENECDGRGNSSSAFAGFISHALCNAGMGPTEVRKYCPLDGTGHQHECTCNMSSLAVVGKVIRTRHSRIILGFHSENPCESIQIRVLKALRATSPADS